MPNWRDALNRFAIEFAERMKTSRATLDRILDPTNPSLTVASLGKAAAALGRKVELRLVPVKA